MHARRLQRVSIAGQLHRPEVLQRLGAVAQVISRSKRQRFCDAQYIDRVLMHADRAGHLLIYVNERGEPVGYCAWAEVCAETEERFFSTGVFQPRINEWDEGGNLWIIDLAAIHGTFFDIASDIRKRFRVEHREVSYVRVKNGKAIFKSVKV